MGIKEKWAQHKKQLMYIISVTYSLLIGFVIFEYLFLGDNGYNIEKERFLERLKDWPEKKPKAAIYILTYVGMRGSLLKTLHFLDKNFNDKFKYPVILFHNGDLTPYMANIRNNTKSDIYFQQIKFIVPNFVAKLGRIPDAKDIPCNGKSYLSYRHMCRFMAKVIFEEPIMQNLEYAWRLDDDSFITRPIPYDVFEFMQNRGLEYGFHSRTTDPDSCIVGLHEAVVKYIHKNALNFTRFQKWKKNDVYYNNFEIWKGTAWRGKSYRNFVDYLDRIGGMYFHRWGDAPIRTYAAQLFIKDEKIHQFQDISYIHGNQQLRTALEKLKISNTSSPFYQEYM